MTRWNIRPLRQNLTWNFTTANESMLMGYQVCLNTNGTVRRAENDLNSHRARQIGIATGMIDSTPPGDTTEASEVAAGSRIAVTMLGFVGGFEGLTPGGIYWVGNVSGTRSLNKPSVSGRYTVTAGLALSPNVMFVRPVIERITELP